MISFQKRLGSTLEPVGGFERLLGKTKIARKIDTANLFAELGDRNFLFFNNIRKVHQAVAMFGRTVGTFGLRVGSGLGETASVNESRQASGETKVFGSAVAAAFGNTAVSALREYLATSADG